MKINRVALEKKCRNPKEFPSPILPEIAFAGRSNVGKSSLINSLLNRQGLVAVSSQPGKTRSINFFLVNDCFRMVDLPGYGYAKVPLRVRTEWKHLIESYLRGRSNLVQLIWILDIRRDVSDLDFMLEEWLGAYGVPYVCVCTKADKFASGKREAEVRRIRETLAKPMDPVIYSARTGLGKAALWKHILASLRGNQPASSGGGGDERP